MEIWLECVPNRSECHKAQGRLDFNPALDFGKNTPVRTTDFPLNKQTERTRIMERGRKTQREHKPTESYRGRGLNGSGPFSPMIHCKWDVTPALATPCSVIEFCTRINDTLGPAAVLIVINAGVYGGKPPMTYQSIRRALEGPITHSTQQTPAHHDPRNPSHWHNITQREAFKYVWDFKSK